MLKRQLLPPALVPEQGVPSRPVWRGDPRLPVAPAEPQTPGPRPQPQGSVTRSVPRSSAFRTPQLALSKRASPARAFTHSVPRLPVLSQADTNPVNPFCSWKTPGLPPVLWKGVSGQARRRGPAVSQPPAGRGSPQLEPDLARSSSASAAGRPCLLPSVTPGNIPLPSLLPSSRPVPSSRPQHPLLAQFPRLTPQDSECPGRAVGGLPVWTLEAAP